MSGSSDFNAKQVRLGELCRSCLPDFRLVGDSTGVVRGISDDSRRVEEGDCFVAVGGTCVDGHDFIEAAVGRGAGSVVAEERLDVPAGVGLAVVDDAREALAKLASVHYGLRDLQGEGEFDVVGVTGTNGKSTTAHLIRGLLSGAGRKTGLLGTIEYDLCGRRVPASLTTPGAVELTRHLMEMASNGARWAVMEASSHALDQRRVDGVRFGAAVFTNLTGDHRDYHPTPAHYRRAKKRLFDGLDGEAAAVVNCDDPAWEAMVSDCASRVFRYGMGRDAEVGASRIEAGGWGTRFVLTTPTGEVEVTTRLIGQHNVSNVLAAAGVWVAMGLELDVIAGGIASLTSVPGRLEAVNGEETGFAVLVDYAHTDDALKNVLEAVGEVCAGRLIVLFGCGGDRDRSKRPRMARVCERLANEIVVTSDNPRTEDPEAIIEEILGGFSREGREHVRVEADRRRAIATAIGLAREGDTVLIAGKGHEGYQLVGQDRVWFDDRVVAGEVLKELSEVGA